MFEELHEHEVANHTKVFQAAASEWTLEVDRFATSHEANKCDCSSCQNYTWEVSVCALTRQDRVLYSASLLTSVRTDRYEYRAPWSLLLPGWLRRTLAARHVYRGVFPRQGCLRRIQRLQRTRGVEFAWASLRINQKHVQNRKLSLGLLSLCPLSAMSWL